MLEKQEAIDLAIDEHGCTEAEVLIDKIYQDQPDAILNEYQTQKLLSKIEVKNSWGKNELKFLILDVLTGRV